MNNILSKLLCVFTALFLSFSVMAGSNDTLLAHTRPASAGITKTVVKEANITYPAVLVDHMDESMEYVKKYSDKKRNYCITTWQKGKKYFPKIEAVLKRYDLPEELKVLVALESGFNANAVSSAGAVGYWQMMDEAARESGLRIATGKGTKNKTDDRRNFSKSTLAAAKYLQARCRNLDNDLLLTVASYNCGIGNVWNAIKKSGKAHPSFWDIKKHLPAETRNYVMNFISLSVIFANYDKFLNNTLTFAPKTMEVPVSDNPGRLNSAVTD